MNTQTEILNKVKELQNKTILDLHRLYTASLSLNLEISYNSIGSEMEYSSKKRVRKTK
jgi:hypothetical protein